MELEFANDKENRIDQSMANKGYLSRLLILNWLSKASANGLNRFADPGKLNKLFWLFIILSAYTCLSLHVALLTLRYFSYPTAFEYRLESVLVEMPDITICREGTKETDAESKELNELNKILWEKLFSYEENIDKLRYAPYMFLRASRFSKRLAAQNSYNLKYYRLFCNFLGSPCRDKDFLLFIDTTFYKCFTYRPQKSHLSLSGKILDIGFSSLKGIITDSNNIIVSIHERGTVPLIFNDGVTLLPGRHTKIQFESLKVSLANLPNNKCLENATISLTDAGYIETFKYTKEMCVHQEIQERIEKECGCWSPVVRVMSSNESRYDNCFVKAFDAGNEISADKALDVPYILLSSSVVNDSLTTKNASATSKIKKIRQFLSEWNPNQKILKMNSFETLNEMEMFLEKAKSQFRCHQRILLSSSEYFLNSNCLNACERRKLRTYVTSEEITMEKLLAIKKYVVQPIVKRSNTNSAMRRKRREPNNPSQETTKDKLAASENENVLNWLSSFGNVSRVNPRKRTLARSSTPDINSELEKFTLLSLSIAATPGDEIKQVPLFGIAALLSEIGGVLGLWCGASVISLCEVIQLIWVLFNVAVFSLDSRNRRQIRT